MAAAVLNVAFLLAMKFSMTDVFCRRYLAVFKGANQALTIKVNINLDIIRKVEAERRNKGQAEAEDEIIGYIFRKHWYLFWQNWHKC